MRKGQRNVTIFWTPEHEQGKNRKNIMVALLALHKEIKQRKKEGNEHCSRIWKTSFSKKIKMFRLKKLN